MERMDFLLGLVGTLGLNKTFFFQFFLVTGLYILLNRILFRPYFDFLKKRETLTKGRFLTAQNLESQTLLLKKSYQEKSKKLHAQFDKLFSKIKKDLEKEFQIKERALKKAQTEFLKTKKSNLLFAEEEAKKELKKSLPSLTESLFNKIRGSL